MRTFATALALMILGTQSSALSCLRPDVVRSFHQIAAAEERYFILLGAFEFRAPPEQGVSNDAQSQEVVSQFTGSAVGFSDFIDMPPLEVTLRTTCAGPWCGGFPEPEADVLAFVELTSQGYLLSMGPCGGAVFDPRTVPIVQACMRGEPCQEGAATR